MARSRRRIPQQKSHLKGREGGGGAVPSKRPRAAFDLGWSAHDDDDAAHADHHIESDSGDDDYDDSMDQDRKMTPSDEEEVDDRLETVEEKKVRLAREYLDRIDAKAASEDVEEEHTDDSSASSDHDDDVNGGGHQSHDRVSRELRRERQKQEGTYERFLAAKVREHVRSLRTKAASPPPRRSDSARPLPEGGASMRDWQSLGYVHAMRGHDLAPTCLALAGDDKALSGSKDHSAILWDLEAQRKVSYVCEHWKKTGASQMRVGGQVLSVACTDDARYAAVGRRDATVQIYDIRSKPGGNLLNTFTGHKGPITCLTFRSQSHQLFSGSSDRCIRHYNLDEMVYLETLYGHQFGVTGIDCHRKERPISVGEDRTARAWKLTEDSHLIFRGGAKVLAADCISIVNEDWFLTGHQDGNVSLWFSEKKKAVSSVELAHGAEGEGTGHVGRGIASVASLRMGDVAASGSYDGSLRLWNVQTGRTAEERGLSPIGVVPVNGYINSIVFGPKAKFCVLAVGQEHRLGRWNRINKAQNRIVVVRLRDENILDHETLGSDVEKEQSAKALDRRSASLSTSSDSSNSDSD